MLSAGVPVRLSRFSNQYVSVPYVVDSGMGIMEHGTVVFAPGETLKKIPIEMSPNDTNIEFVRVTLNSPTHAVLTGRSDASLKLSPSANRGMNVVINEILYHPPGDDSKAEFVELYNPGTNIIELLDWQFTKGIHFTFPNMQLAPNEFLVVAADPGTFYQTYPGVTTVFGPWEGTLANGGEELVLEDSNGKKVARVHYNEEGGWGSRILGEIDHGHRGLQWDALADGGGYSLELINPNLDNNVAQNWHTSRNPKGTPGRLNSVYATHSAPFILSVSHSPIKPKSAESVIVTARIVPTSDGVPNVTLFWRIDGQAEFNWIPMVDDGAHGDQAFGDGTYGALISNQTNKSIIEFYIQASDSKGNSRSYPPPVSLDGVSSQTANLLYQVDDVDFTGSLPLYRLIMTARDVAELKQININSPPPPYSDGDQTLSHAAMNATFISQDNNTLEVRYNVDVRNRGSSSRYKQPQGFRVNFSSEQRWNGVKAINLNSQCPHGQLAGAAIYSDGGAPSAAFQPGSGLGERYQPSLSRLSILRFLCLQ